MATTNGVFLDTNVLVYQFDRTNPLKQKKAQDLIELHIKSGQALISSQVFQEFMNVAFKKFDTQTPEKELRLVMQELLVPLCQHFPDTSYYERALNLYSAQALSFYDAMIIQAALDLGCKTLYSEDLQDGHRYSTLTVLNPFK